MSSKLEAELRAKLNRVDSLPRDDLAGALVGRVWLGGAVQGPAVVALREEGVFDISRIMPTMAELTAADVGIHPQSYWNNPEPEVVLIVSPSGQLVGATLGNDVNLRDFEGRSALLLGRAKDNNASCAIGPFIRLLDETFSVDHIRYCEVSLHVTGGDGFELHASSSMREISRDVLDLVNQTINRNHQYPDGLALFTGTMFAPVKDREGLL